MNSIKGDSLLKEDPNQLNRNKSYELKEKENIFKNKNFEKANLEEIYDLLEKINHDVNNADYYINKICSYS